MVSMQGDKQTVDSGWDSILGRVERGCPLDKVMFGQRPKWGKRDDVWMSWGRVPANYDDPGDQSMAGKFKEEQRGPGGRVQWVRGKSGSWGQRQRGGPDHVRAGRQQQDFAHTLESRAATEKSWAKEYHGATCVWKKLNLAILRKTDWGERVAGKNENRETS